MGKYVIVLCIGILIGNALRRILEKYCQDILIGIMYVVMFVLIVPLYVITFPIRIINAIGNASVTESKIIREYDRIFCEAETMENVSKIIRKITRFEKVLKHKLISKEKKKSKID